MSFYYKVYCPSDTVRGDVLSYNTSTSLWEKASNSSTPIGVAQTDAQVRGDGFEVELVLSGYVEAKASRSIPAEGGYLHIENGQVYADNSSMGVGMVCPQLIDITTPRNAGDLVSILIR